MEEKEPLIILTGPPAVGKTDLSLKLAKRVDGNYLCRFHAGIPADGYRIRKN